MDNKHFTLNHILPYQRAFNFVNAIRSIGKTYGSYYYFIKDWKENGNEFVAICRTQEEKKQGYLQKAVQKVLLNEFPEMYNATDEKDKPLLKYNSDQFTYDGVVVGRCIALSEAVKIKKNAYPLVKWMFFDEYAIEEDNQAARYINGWNEPDLLLSIYHTIDREEDRVICFCMANNISAYNPYHLHPAFKIPYTDPGKTYKSKNVFFENAVPSEELKAEKTKSRFLEMIEGTTYGDMATGGKYIYDSDALVMDMPLDQCIPFCTLIYNGKKYGLWRSKQNTNLLVSDKINPTIPSKYALTQTDMTEDTQLAQRHFGKLGYFSTVFKMGYVRFSSMEVKKRFAEVMPYLI